MEANEDVTHISRFATIETDAWAGVGMRYAAAHCRAAIYGENINKTELPAAEEAPDQTV